MLLFKVENLIYFYPDREQPALEGINLEIGEGEFILVAGESGSGKSSLARVLAGLLPDFYGGRFGGRVFFKGQEMRKIDRRRLAREVGMVFQDPEKQLVMTSIEAEIAFGLENLGLSRQEMFRRVAEVISFLGLSAWKKEFTANLSGGQKQKIALAAVLAMQPRVLILDEPTSQLDPVAAEDLLNLVKRFNEEMGFTIILIEQRLERCFHLADRVILMEQGRVVRDGTPAEIARWAAKGPFQFIPPVARFFTTLGFSSIPVTVKEGRRQLRQCLALQEEGDAGTFSLEVIKQDKKVPAREAVIEIRNLWFTYPNGREVLQDIKCKIEAGELVAILGENGGGKSTLLKNIVGLLKPGRGKVTLSGNSPGKNGGLPPGRLVAYLSQNPNDYLFQDTVEEELLFTLKNFGLTDDGIIDELLERLHINCYRRINPRDLSSGERQRVALASVLVTRPKIIVLDEPTRGIDYRLKAELGSFLAEQAREGASIILVTHDVEFAAEYATRVIMMFSGRIACDGAKQEVFGKSVFYSTQIGKLCRGFDNSILTVNEAINKISPLLQVKQIASGDTLKKGGELYQ